jgi:hypothetical protein
VVLTALVAGAVLLPVWFALLPSTALLVATPENSAALTARRVVLGCVTVIVPPFGSPVALCTAKTSVRTSAVFVLSARAAP